MTLQTVYYASLASGVLTYLALTVFCVIAWGRKIVGRAAFSASLMTLIMMMALAVTGTSALSWSATVLAELAWITLLVRITGVARSNVFEPTLRPVVVAYGIAVVLVVAGIVYAWSLPLARARGLELPVAAVFIIELLVVVCGLVLLEQVIRNTRDDLRWRLRHLYIGIGTLLGFQMVHNVCALLFNVYLPGLVAIQPAALSIPVPFIAMGLARNKSAPLKLNLSRQFVFRTGVLIATGALMMLTGALAYLVRLLGDWPTALLALAVVAIVVGTITLFGSASVRVRGRRWMEEHLFPSKYDYRDQWRRVTAQLTEPSPDYELPEQVLRALGQALESRAGTVWWLTQQNVLVPAGSLGKPRIEPLPAEVAEEMKAYFETNEGLLDLESLPPSAHRAATWLSGLADSSSLRFVVPLMTDARLLGIAALERPSVPIKLSWEDRELLVLIARQASGVLALRTAERELAEADRLNGFNQVSAFIVHDVKTITAQLSLILDNARKHKDNPAFIDDMLTTIGNSEQRMRKLLAQLHDGQLGDAPVTTELRTELPRWLEPFASQQPAPIFQSTGCEGGVRVTADVDKLRGAIGHLIQNAIDAAGSRPDPETGEPQVCVRLCRHDPWAEVVIEDSGPGMDPDFVDKSLFAPLASTKGVSGMGMGAYQARSYVRALGGEVSVRSQPGRGTCFTVRLPIAQP